MTDTEIAIQSTTGVTTMAHQKNKITLEDSLGKEGIPGSYGQRNHPTLSSLMATQ
jgi:hypothetical protein